MDIRQLNYFVTVADCGNYSMASKKLFVSQPALSKTIKNMEEELGFPFFYTQQRRQHLTDAGQAFYTKAVHLLKEYHSLIGTSYSDLSSNKGHLSIGLSSSAGPALFCHISPRFTSEYPLIDLSIVEKNSSVLKKEIFNRDTDAAFIDLKYLREDEESMFDIFRLIQSDLVAVVPASDPLSEKESVTYMDLNNRDMILFQRDETSAAQLDIDYKDSESRPKIIFSSSQWHMVFDLVELGLGLTIAPYYIFERLKRPELKALPIKEESSKRTIALIAKRDDNRSKALRTFIEFASNRELYDDITDMLTL